MHTTLRKIGNSRGVIIPAALLNACGLIETVDLRLEGSRLVIEAVKTPRADWFQGYDAARVPLPGTTCRWMRMRLNGIAGCSLYRAAAKQKGNMGGGGTQGIRGARRPLR